jgi:hypothetical protein
MVLAGMRAILALVAASCPGPSRSAPPSASSPSRWPSTGTRSSPRSPTRSARSMRPRSRPSRASGTGSVGPSTGPAKDPPCARVGGRAVGSHQGDRARHFSDGASGAAGAAPSFAGGGQVRGPGTGTSDSILARLSHGEFVIRARAVQHYGAELFERLNAMRMPPNSIPTLVPAFAGGGLVVPLPAENRRWREPSDSKSHDRRRDLSRVDGAARCGRAADPLRPPRKARRPAGGRRGSRAADALQDGRPRPLGPRQGQQTRARRDRQPFWGEFAERLVPVEANAGAANGIANNTVVAPR